MKIWIDAGHGGYDPGAVGLGRREKDDTLRFALALERCFLARGHEVVLTRREDVAVELSRRTRLERESKCDLAISCHRNGATTQARGFELWLHHAPVPEVVEWARDVAQSVEREGFPLRSGTVAPGVYTGYRTDPALDYAVNRETNAPSMLLELGFVTSAEDNAVFDEHIQSLAEAVAAAGLRFLGAEAPPETDWMARAQRAEERLRSIHALSELA